MGDPFAIETSGLTRYFGDFCAVSNLNLHVPKGSVYAFIGPNGAGKTTTIRMLLGLIRPDEGHIKLNGVGLSTQRKAALSSVGSIVETPTLYPNLSGRDVLKLSAHLLKIDDDDIENCLDIVNLTASADRLVKTYSLGMRQRLALARSLLGSPKLLILDEPTNGLDPNGMIEIREVIKSLPKRFGTTVLLSSHLLDEIDRMADHCAFINKGTLNFQGAIAELKQRSKTELKVRTSNEKELTSFLSAKNLKYKYRNRTFEISEKFDQHAAEIFLNSLISASISLHHFSLETTSLEDIFLELTQN